MPAPGTHTPRHNITNPVFILDNGTERNENGAIRNAAGGVSDWASSKKISVHERRKHRMSMWPQKHNKPNDPPGATEEIIMPIAGNHSLESFILVTGSEGTITCLNCTQADFSLLSQSVKNYARSREIANCLKETQFRVH